jgi:hypothetical protein
LWKQVLTVALFYTALQAEAAAAQRSFERSRMLLEAQLSQLAAAISSQETLISTLQSNEAEARNMGALYLVGGAEFNSGALCLLVHMPCLTACYCPNSIAWCKP